MIELATHQRVAVDRILILLDRYKGAILADEVGLGKSFVAAAVAAALPANTIEVITPASLVDQWKETLGDFGVGARVITHDALLGDRFVAQPQQQRLLIVDEAHAFRNSSTQRYHALALRSIGAKLLLVTATPICNSPDDLYSLVALLVADDSGRFLGVASVEQAFRTRDANAIRSIISEVVIRRDRDVLSYDLQFGTIERRVIRHPLLEAHGIDALQFPLISDHHALLRRILWRRLESSEAALLESIRRQTRFYERALDCLRTGRMLGKREYRRAFGHEEDRDAFQEVLFWDVFAPAEARIDADEIREEMRRLDALAAAAAAAPKRKREMLIDILGEPMLIFTAAIATARDLRTAIPNAGIMTSRGMQPIDALDGFRRGRIDTLICTDLASEGLNLQRAGVVVHYDIPWNPVKLDQRNGRAWRIGQRRDRVQAIYFIPDSRRTRIIETVASKNRTRRRLLDGGLAVDRTAISLLALPPRLTRDSPAVALIRRLRDAGLAIPPHLARRYRAGIERLFNDMAAEYIDERRLRELLALVECEIIGGSGPPDRR
ncbi:MAG: DEAD/DEAH box helicase [Acidobacteriota bacterium]|nr:DEAD/DEAH box helicase [Acidobacteriota bacterium]